VISVMVVANFPLSTLPDHMKTHRVPLPRLFGGRPSRVVYKILHSSLGPAGKGCSFRLEMDGLQSLLELTFS
jgi:hypothetical protein